MVLSLRVLTAAISQRAASPARTERSQTLLHRATCGHTAKFSTITCFPDGSVITSNIHPYSSDPDTGQALSQSKYILVTNVPQALPALFLGEYTMRDVPVLKIGAGTTDPVLVGAVSTEPLLQRPGSVLRALLLCVAQRCALRLLTAELIAR